ncbi:hypothetical protein [uncultured Alloprevotella sp.]|uniref:hypothetical protein n=1 Tax=uncultured Alloprevotella sp. TaxID=1283315 RepID=UPI00325F9A9E
MAKYTITYKCGHTEEMQLFGKMNDRDRKIAWYATQDCPECKAAAARAAAKERGLVELEGTAKQIVWAEQIRAKFLELSEQIKKQLETKAEDPRVLELFAVLDDAKSNSKASFWIDNRYDLDSVRGIIIWTGIK